MSERKKRASYASRRVDLAVNRMLQAKTFEEKARAVRWAAAWGRITTPEVYGCCPKRRSK